MLNAEMWDKMQHVMERYNDHMVHASLEIVGRLDERLVRKALQRTIGKVKILRTHYKTNFFSAKWEEIDNFDVKDIFSIVSTDKDIVEISEAFLTGKIDEKKEAQIKVLLVKNGEKARLNFLVNHQCFDGADFKEFLALFIEYYNCFKRGEDKDIPFKDGSRSHEQIYEGFSEEEKKEIDTLLSYSKKQKDKIVFPFEKSKREEQYAKFTKLTVQNGLFESIKAKTKAFGISINDLVLAAFFRTLSQMVELKEGQALGIPNMVNLRRYMKDGKSLGMCNLTSMVVSNLGSDIGKDIKETVLKVKADMDSLKNKYMGLNGLALLKKVFQYAPYQVAKFLIGTFFKNPLIGISNIGIIDEASFVIEGAEVTDLFMTGSIKYPPYMQLSLIYFKGKLNFAIANYGTENDHKMLEAFFEKLLSEFKAFAALKA